MSLDLSTLRALVIDVDGVLWHGKQSLPGVPEFFGFLHAHQISFVIATNNSARPASDVVDRLAQMGAHIDETNVLTSAQATALYLQHIAPHGARVYLIGGEGLAQAVTRAGFQLVDKDAEFVVSGIDWTLTYEKLKRATIEIRKGAKFIGTNGDKTFPSEDGVVPGAGSILAAIQTATDVAPLIIGKPERAMFDMAVEIMGATRETTATLGDRLDTDIEGGQRAGLKSILVMTGVTTPQVLSQSSIQPDCAFDDLNALRQAWERSY